jgi:hypothetical protein
MNPTIAKLNYEERQAFEVVRKTLKRKPELAPALLEGMSKQVAVNVLLQAKKELDDLMSVSGAITRAAGELVKLEKQDENL